VKEVLDASKHSVPFADLMGVVLGIIAIAVLLVLIVASVKVRRETKAAERQQAEVRTNTGQAQHEESLRRRDEVRAAPAEPAETIASHTDD
jgi:predicted Holliday junction resolvase-like endonuclease